MKNKLKKSNFILASILILSTNILKAQEKIGIGVDLPIAKLDVGGDLRVEDIQSVEVSDVQYILTVDKNNIVKKIDKKLLESKETILENSIYGLLKKGANQILSRKNVDYPVLFKGSFSGINTKNISVNQTNGELEFPANKVFKVTGTINVRGSGSGGGQGKPGYITSMFEIINGNINGNKLIFSTLGFTESSTETFDDGGTSQPLILFKTGPAGAKIRLLAQYGGSTASAENYYLAGDANRTSVGSYIIIEEL